MNLLTRGIHGYLVIVGGIALLAVVWWANQYLFKNTTAEAGWPLLVGAAMLLVVLIVGVRRLMASSVVAGVYHRPTAPYGWGSRQNRSDNGDDTTEHSAQKTYFSEDKFSRRSDSVRPIQK